MVEVVPDASAALLNRNYHKSDTLERAMGLTEVAAGSLCPGVLPEASSTMCSREAKADGAVSLQDCLQPEKALAEPC